MKLESASFTHEGKIPRRHTCEGQDASPALSWTGVPPGTQTLALVVDDPDAPDPQAPRTVWVHWVLYNLPASLTGLPDAIDPAQLPAGVLQGRNDFRRTSWGGPCPPIGRHRYFFKLYALDTTLDHLGAGTKADLERAMQGHTLATATLMGTYQKGDP
jgi:Raf kinase inhibitor-like YbhB/YbcL family protein